MTNGGIVRRYLAHLGIILCHLSILGVALMLGNFFGFILYILVFLMGITIILSTAGTIFLFVPDYLNKLKNIVETMGRFFETSSAIIPTIGIITAICCVSSIVLTSLDTRWEKSRTRLIISSIMVLTVLVLLAAIIFSALRGEA